MKSIVTNHLFFLPTLIGLIVFVISIVSKIFPPKTINALYGYRTEKSMLSQEAWDFAQKYSSNLMSKASLVLILVGVCGLFVGNIGIVGLFIAMLSMITMFIFVIIRTEKELSVRFPKKKLNKNESRRITP